MDSCQSYVSSLTNEHIYNELKTRGFHPGPVVASTRDLYAKKLVELLELEQAEDSATTSHTSDFTGYNVSPRQGLGTATTGYSLGPRQSLHSAASTGSSRATVDISPSYLRSETFVRQRESLPQIRKSFGEAPLPRPSATYNRPSGFSSDYSKFAAASSAGKTTSSQIKLLIIVVVALIAIYLLYSILTAWNETDPYLAIEEAARKALEEAKKME